MSKISLPLGSIFRAFYFKGIPLDLSRISLAHRSILRDSRVFYLKGILHDLSGISIPHGLILRDSRVVYSKGIPPPRRNAMQPRLQTGRCFRRNIHGKSGSKELLHVCQSLNIVYLDLHYLV